MKTKLLSVIFFVSVVASNNTTSAQLVQATKYEWIKHARIFIIDGYNYPLWPKIEYDAGKLAETMVDMHANVVRIATSGHRGWLIPGTEFKIHQELGKRDILAETIAACNPKGIKVVPYLAAGHTMNSLVIKPEWAQKMTPAGDILTFWSMGEKVNPCCWNTGYRQAFYGLVKTIVSKYDIDAIYFDNWFPFRWFGGPEKICYCDGCMTGFKKATGQELPYRKNTPYTSTDLKTIGMYRNWYREELFKVFSETKRIVKSFKEIPLIYNIENPTKIMNEDFRILQGHDAFLYERGGSLVERAEGVSLATSHGLAVWPYIGTYDQFPRIPHFNYELQQEILTSVAFGGSPILYHTYFFTGHPEARGPIKEAFNIFDENDKYIKDFNSDKFCAVVWNNTDPPGHDMESWLWNTNARLSSLGSFSALLNNHIQTTSLLKQDLDNFDLLSKYKVLFLPDICFLSDKQVKNITRFVENGGGLVMTYATSLFDESGKKRSDFALGHLAKIKYHHPQKELSEKIAANLSFGSVYDMYLKVRPGQDVIKSPPAGKLIPTHLYETVDVLTGGTVIADLVRGNDHEPVVPGLVVARYGKGKVAYISAANGALFQQTGIMELADFLSGIIEYVSPDRLPYEIDAPPSSLITNMTVNADKRVFHLINRTGPKTERTWQNVYYIPPIENVSIKFKIPEGKKIKRVTSFVPAEFLQNQKKNILEITIPRIERYQGIVIEMD